MARQYTLTDAREILHEFKRQNPWTARGKTRCDCCFYNRSYRYRYQYYYYYYSARRNDVRENASAAVRNDRASLAIVVPSGRRLDYLVWTDNRRLVSSTLLISSLKRFILPARYRNSRYTPRLQPYLTLIPSPQEFFFFLVSGHFRELDRCF